MHKKFRIKKNHEFQKIIFHKKIINTYNFVFYSKKNDLNFPRFGISVSKKLGNAAVRNKIKRQLRMFLINLSKEINFNNKKSIDIIIIVKKKFLLNNFEENQKVFNKIIKQIID
ncbi:ribonuclease P protein component [Spiroplasma endosymbiont of Amphibalanus improvisus]|uniref:ribonuclease P protein component n=1 Tax=Spiroplasma endosymbiont of Amphibalanus improvisus TaxID=3066327 RepID=UPI00313D2BDE